MPVWFGILMGLVSMVGTMAMGGFFTACQFSNYPLGNSRLGILIN
jgi:hypothetical protein